VAYARRPYFNGNGSPRWMQAPRIATYALCNITYFMTSRVPQEK
jgi:hypothetical protein